MPATMAAWGGAVLTVTVDDVDVACDALALTVDRSKNRLWDPVDATTCQITLNLEAGGVAAATGPIGSLVVVNVAWGAVDRNLFTGRVQLRRLEAAPAGDVLVLDCVDGFETLGRVNVRAAALDTPVGGSETVEMRIARWLDVADWSATDRDFGSSAYTCPETLIDGNVLVQLQAATLADGGEFFIDGDGVATFLAWAWRTATGPVAAVYSDRRLHDWVPYSSATLNDDLDEVQNQVTGTRRAVDDTDHPVGQTSTNTGSVTAYGQRGDALDNLELEDDTQVADRVTALVAIAGVPSPRFDQVVVQPAFDPARMWPRVIPCKFGSLVAANRVWPDATETALYGHILGEIWTFTPDDATVTWRVSGTGSWDAHAPPRPPIAVEVTPGGCVRIPDGLPCDDTSTVQFEDADGNPVGDPFPPGSLCGAGICDIPEGATQVCLVNDFGEGCIDLPTATPILWFDVLDPGPNLIEKVEGTALTHLFGFSGTRLDVTGTVDAIDATSTGGPIVEDHSDTLQAADISAGWVIDWWLYLTVDLDADTNYGIIDVGNIIVQLTTAYDTVTQVELIVFDAGLVEHLSGPLGTVALGGWHHWRIVWTGDDLRTFVDGTEQPSAVWGFVPADRTGGWGVVLPGEASIGELIVDYFVTPALTGWHWACDETALPLLEEHGFGHTLTSLPSGAAYNFHQPSARADATGYSISQAVGTGADPDALWTPPITVDPGDTWAIACLISAGGAARTGLAGIDVRLENLGALDWSTITSTPQNLHLYLNHGAGPVLIGAPSASTSLGFAAFKVDPSGNWTFWHGSSFKTTGTDASFVLPATTAVRVASNDPDVFRFQDIYVWHGATVDDAAIEAVRDYLT